MADIDGMFYGLELLPNREYKLTVGQDASVEFTQVTLGPLTPANCKGAVLSCRQLEDDSDDEDDGEEPAFIVARLGIGAADCKKLKGFAINGSSVMLTVSGRIW